MLQIAIIMIIIGCLFLIADRIKKNKPKEDEVVKIDTFELKKLESSEKYISRAVQEHFYNLNKERLTREEFKQIIDQTNSEQAKMFLNHIYDHYEGWDNPHAKYIPFSRLIDQASNKSGYRLD